MTQTMENVEDSLERSSDTDDSFYSTTESPRSPGDLGSSASLLALQLAVVCARLHQRSRTQSIMSAPPFYPIGLPRLKERTKRNAEAIIKGKLQHSTDSLGKPSLRALHEGQYQQLWSDSCSSSAQQPQSVGELASSRKSPRVRSDDGYACTLRQMRLKKGFQGASLQEQQAEQSISSQELEAVQDIDDLACSSNVYQDRESFSCISKQRIVDDDEGFDTLSKIFEEVTDTKNVTAGQLSDDFFKAGTRGLVVADQNKVEPWSSDIDLKTADVRSFHKDENNLHDSSQTTLVSSDSATVPNTNVLLSSEIEDAYTNRAPEQGQLDSLLLWPVGLAVEAIAFQVRLIAQAFSLVAILYDWCNSFASNRVRETLEAKERATEALSQKVSMLTNVPPKVTESGSMVLKRAGWGCFAALYVCILLSMLLFPTLILDYVFVSKIVEDPVDVQEPLHFDYTLRHPAAVVFLYPSGGKLGIHSERARPIPVSHKVHITVFLTLPESDYNRELGMFQLSAELLSETGEIIKSSSRPCMLRFHSWPIRMMKTLLFSLPSLVGMFTESQTLVVHLLEFEEQRVPTTAVSILVQPKAGMQVGQGIPEIYSAYVHIESHLPWLKNMMRKWKWTVYIWTGLTLYVVEITMILCCCRQALVPKAWVGQNDDIKADEIESVEEVGESGGRPSGDQLRKEQVPAARRHSLHEHMPIARAVLYRQEHKVSQGRHTSM